MTYRLSISIWVLGLAALVAVVFPQVVMLGYFAGFLPGVVLGLAPSLFCYLLLWIATRELLLWGGAVPDRLTRSDGVKKAVRLLGGVLALVFLIAVGDAIPRAINKPLDQRAATLQADDTDIDGSISLPAVVATVMPEPVGMRNDISVCETLCQRLLFNKVVSRVIVSDKKTPSKGYAFWLERGASCADVKLPQYDVVWPDDHKVGGRGPRDRVQARIVAGDCLIQADADVADAEATISFTIVKKSESILARPWDLFLDTLGAKRLQIIGADGRIIYRRTEVTYEELHKPLQIETRAGLLTSVSYVGWSRFTRMLSPLGPSGRDILPKLLGVGARPPDLP